MVQLRGNSNGDDRDAYLLASQQDSDGGLPCLPLCGRFDQSEAYSCARSERRQPLQQHWTRLFDARGRAWGWLRRLNIDARGR